MAADDIVWLDRQHRAEDLDLLLGNSVSVDRGGRLHCGEGQHLEEVRDHHVSIRAGGFIERGSLLETERLGDIDLDMVDHVAMPDRLEQTIGETERQDIERGFLPEEVIDAEHLILVEDFVHCSVQSQSAIEIRPERLFHDDSTVLDQVCLVERLDHRQRSLGWHR